MPSSSPLQTMLKELQIKIEAGEGGGWKIQPGDVTVLGVKEVS